MCDHPEHWPHSTRRLCAGNMAKKVLAFVVVAMIIPFLQGQAKAMLMQPFVRVARHGNTLNSRSAPFFDQEVNLYPGQRICRSDGACWMLPHFFSYGLKRDMMGNTIGRIMRKKSQHHRGFFFPRSNPTNIEEVHQSSARNLRSELSPFRLKKKDAEEI